MSQGFEAPSPEDKPLSWSEVWISALTQPSVQTYERLVHDPNASGARAYGWVFICGLIGYFLSALIGLAISGLFNIGSLGRFYDGFLFGSLSAIQLACLAPVAGIAAVVVLVINAGITQLIARILGGTGTYSELVYAYAAYIAPLSLLSAILFAIPFANFCLGFPLLIYGIALAVIALNAVNQFGWGKAIASAIIVPLAIAVIIPCMVFAMLTLLGPQIGDVFSEILRDLSTPAP